MISCFCTRVHYSPFTSSAKRVSQAIVQLPLPNLISDPSSSMAHPLARYPSSTHACLYVDEIARQIVTHLLGRHLHGTASALGQTCRSLFLTAIPELWRDLGDLIPLFKLIPQEIFDALEKHQEISPDTSFSVNSFVSIRAPLPCLTSVSLQPQGVALDWDRFEFYAPYIRSLGTPGYISFDHELDIEDLLNGLDDVLQRRYREYGPLTPELRRLAWAPDISIMHNPSMGLFLPDTLVAVEIYSCPDDCVFEQLEDVARGLRHIGYLTMDDTTTNIYENAAIAMLGRAHALETLSWDIELSFQVLRLIANAATLENLHVRLMDDHDDVLYSSIELPTASFPALRVLSITGLRLSDIQDFLICVRAAPLSALIIDAMEPIESDEALRPLVSELLSYHSDTLIHLRISETTDSTWCNQDDPEGYSSPFLTKAELSFATGARTIANITPGSAQLGLRILKANFGALTQTGVTVLLSFTLAELEIVPANGNQLTLSTLLVVAEHCQQLQRLTILLSARSVPSRGSSSLLPELEYLNVVRSTISNAQEVALFLVALCPRLTIVECASDAVVNDAQRWHEVGRACLGTNKSE